MILWPHVPVQIFTTFFSCSLLVTDRFSVTVQLVFVINVIVQMKYYADCHRAYSDLCSHIDADQNVTTDSLNRTIQQKLSEIRALSISTADNQL